MSKQADLARSAVFSTAPLTPEEIERLIAATQATVADLTADRQRAAFDTESGVDGASERLADINRRLQDARDRTDTLSSAMVAANAEAESQRLKLQAKLRKDNTAKVVTALSNRDKAAERLTAALETAAAAWHDLVEQSERAAIPVPGVPELHGGEMVYPKELRRAVERELWRVGAWPKAVDASPGRDPRNFPGGNAHDFDFVDQPRALPRLADEVRGLPALPLPHQWGGCIDDRPTAGAV